MLFEAMEIMSGDWTSLKPNHGLILSLFRRTSAAEECSTMQVLKGRLSLGLMGDMDSWNTDTAWVMRSSFCSLATADRAWWGCRSTGRQECSLIATGSVRCQ